MSTDTPVGQSCIIRCMTATSDTPIFDQLLNERFWAEQHLGRPVWRRILDTVTGRAAT